MKKTPPNIEVCVESLRAMLEYNDILNIVYFEAVNLKLFYFIPFSLYIFPHMLASFLWPALLNHSPSDSTPHSMQTQLPWSKYGTYGNIRAVI